MVCRTALDLLVDLYFPAMNSQSQQIPAFCRCEVLHVHKASEIEDAQQRLRKIVKERSGWDLTCISEEEIYARSTTLADVASTGWARLDGVEEPSLNQPLQIYLCRTATLQPARRQ